MFIGIAATIPDLANLPGQGGEGITVTLDYPSSNVCYDGTTSPSDASPAGGVFSYTGSGTLDLNTSTGAINAAGSNPGSYTVIYTKSGVSSNFPIVIGNDITLSIATVPGTTICTGDTATLTANASGGTGSFSYSWSTGGAGSSISVAPTTITTYTVTVTDGNGCTATASQAITPSTNATTIASIDNNAAMSFNGTDSYVNVSDYESAITNGNITLSMWFKTSSTSQQYLIATSQTYGTACSLFMPGNASGQLWFRRGNNTGAGEVTAKTSNGYNDGNWHHVICTSDANMKIYVDGVLDIQASVSTPTVSSSQFLVIGRNGSSGTLLFNGELDEVAIFNSVLSSCDIKGIYEGSIGGNAGKVANLLDANTTIPAPVYWNRMGDS